MAGPSLNLVVVCGASASRDSVRRAIWLPREPDAWHPLRSVLRVGMRRGTLAVTQHEGYVLVHGASALAMEREWLAFSADRCRVLSLRLPDDAAGVCWSLYEDGRRSRRVEPAAGIDEGEPRPFEASPDGTPDPATRVRVLYRALTDREVGEDLDLGAEVGVWFVEG